MDTDALGRVRIVRWHVRFGHEDEEFLDEVLDAPAQLALDSRWVRQERAADGQQLPLPGQLGNTPLPWLVMVAGFGCDIELVDCRGPSGQCGVFGVAGALVVDVPQQVGPAALLGANSGLGTIQRSASTSVVSGLPKCNAR